MLTKEQLLFLHSQGLSKEDTFDALGMTQSTYYPIMKKANKLIAYNTKPCKNGHTMRTRSGHCQYSIFKIHTTIKRRRICIYSH